MNTVERLTQYYQNQPPRLSFGGSERSRMQMRLFDEWPERETIQFLGIIVWRYRNEPELEATSRIRYYVVDVCLDASGKSNPTALPLPLEMQNQKIEIAVYADHLDCIRMRAIGSYTAN